MICHCARTTLGLSTATGATRSRLTSTSSSKRGRGPSTRHMPLRRLWAAAGAHRLHVPSSTGTAVNDRVASPHVGGVPLRDASAPGGAGHHRPSHERGGAERCGGRSCSATIPTSTSTLRSSSSTRSRRSAGWQTAWPADTASSGTRPMPSLLTHAGHAGVSNCSARRSHR
jgi:hypothetical protein